VTESKARPWEGTGEGGSFGSWLRRQREAREITLREIAETSKISLRYLEALEQDRFDLLPGPLFAKGFLREYAKFVGLDPDEVVNYYLSALPPEDGTDRQRPHPAPRPRIPWLVITLVAVAVAALGGALWFFSSRSEHEGAPPAIVAPARVDSGGDAAAEERSGKAVVVTLDFTQNSWVDAFVDGSRTVSELRVQGESLRLEADREVRFRLSNPAGVNVEVNGRGLDLGATGGDEFVSIGLDDIAAEGVAAEGPDESDPDS